MNQTPRNEPITTPPVRDIEDLASFTECTGLIPAGVPTDEEAEDYARLYGIHPIKANDITRDGLPDHGKPVKKQ
ncbi:MAG: hypothetical protein E7323_13585 [Clostridiales bacterium]|nr:hypothetical protein [Clostridiales bacterium]